MKGVLKSIALESGKFGYLAIAFCLVEVIIIWGGRSLALGWPELDWHWLRTVMIFAYVFGFLSSLVLSIAGLANDLRPKLPAITAIVLVVVDLDICSWPIAY